MLQRTSSPANLFAVAGRSVSRLSPVRKKSHTGRICERAFLAYSTLTDIISITLWEKERCRALIRLYEVGMAIALQLLFLLYAAFCIYCCDSDEMGFALRYYTRDAIVPESAY